MPRRVFAALLAAFTFAAALVAAVPAPAFAAGEKVAIIVGPVGGGSLQSYFLSSADELASVAAAAGATVAKAYSPSATWGSVLAAVNGANVVVYLGHGNGFPNPYSSVQHTDRVNGWGLNRTANGGHGDDWSSTLVYCGEKALLGTLTSSDGAAQRQYCSGGPITPAPGFVMVYAGAHYAPGFGECYVSSCAVATFDEARARVANYSRPVLLLGASAFYATVHQSGAREIVRQVLTQPDKAVGQIFRDSPGYSAPDLVVVGHPDVGGAETWLQRTVVSGMHFGKPDYWYAFAGNPAVTPSGGVNSSLDVDRYGAANRYGTAASLSAVTFAPGVPVAYLATGFNFPDALAGAVAAAVRGGPVLLVTPDVVPSETVAELDRLNPGEIVVLGGSSVVSDAVAAAVQGYATSGTVRRLAGPDRYATAAAVSADTFAPGVPAAYIATGLNFPDALAGAAAAAKVGAPVLMVNSTLPAATAAELDRLDPQKIVLLGSTGVVSDAVAAAVAAYTGGPVERRAGPDRYATAAAISSAHWSSADTVFVATGANFPDALAGAAVAGGSDRPLLLVTYSDVPAPIRDELLRLDPDRVVVLGASGVVSQSVVYQMQALFPAE